MNTQIWAWLTDPARWSGPEGITRRLLEHLGYSVISVLVAALVAVPLGLWIGHTGRARWLVSSTNAVRAIPSLGLLFAAALFLGPYLRGSWAFLLPSLIVLVLLAAPPLLAGTYSGVEAVDPAARDAARGMGMTGLQVLLRVELPCALPLILSGVRSATLQVIGTATIAAYVSLGGLGAFLSEGLAVGDYPMVAGGAFLVALLALTVDVLLALTTRVVVSPGLRPHRVRAEAPDHRPEDDGRPTGPRSTAVTTGTAGTTGS
ncbi:osmoprotectant transport system permease protein [Austwickia chelonae]|uniref:Putative ABC transporter permease protein n=1 Tax=Austwickia chelonae NBRC 105200 TaxID=1184607 RepID=K6W9R0_9MICO|nr:ABC transporter permease [Austwickia chelonae]GAB78557.1 putative ABC transporter permease protein [Austwickia chelonae NBRC 105200]SEW40765.1 osmoprotectant transport system permease protein [Austwickia chelonae]